MLKTLCQSDQHSIKIYVYKKICSVYIYPSLRWTETFLSPVCTVGFRLLLVAVLEALQETEIHKLSYFKGIHFKSILEVHLSYVQKFEISPLTSQKVNCTCFYVTYSFFNRAWNNFSSAISMIPNPMHFIWF